MNKDPATYQIGGNHYKDKGIQPIEIISGLNLNFCRGSIVKYIARYQYKGQPLLDIKKALHYVNFELERLQNIKGAGSDGDIGWRRNTKKLLIKEKLKDAWQISDLDFDILGLIIREHITSYGASDRVNAILRLARAQELLEKKILDMESHAKNND